MKKLQSISEDIDSILVAINPIQFNEKYYLTDTLEEMVAGLNLALEKVNKINLSETEEELWECRTDFKSTEDLILYITTFFSNLLNWKSGINEMNELIAVLNRDISTFELENAFILNTATSKRHNHYIKRYYTQIGIKLHNLKFDFKSIIYTLKNRCIINKALSNMKANQPARFSYKLRLEKWNEFSEIINTCIDNDYFCSTDSKKPFLRIDILNNIGFIVSGNLKNMSPVQKQPDTDIHVTEDTAELQSDYAFSSYLLHSKSVILTEKLKELFRHEKGKSIRLLLLAMENQNPPLITIGNRNFKAIFNALKEAMGRDIGSYQSVVGYKYDEKFDKPDYDSINTKLLHLLKDL